jgi:thioredoxin 1
MITITSDSFQESTKSGAVVVKFFGTWCAPCQALAPIIDELEKNNQDVVFAQINTDENIDLCINLKIRGVPTVIFFKDGVEVQRILGLNKKQTYETALEALK